MKGEGSVGISLWHSVSRFLCVRVWERGREMGETKVKPNYNSEILATGSDLTRTHAGSC